MKITDHLFTVVCILGCLGLGTAPELPAQDSPPAPPLPPPPPTTRPAFRPVPLRNQAAVPAVPVPQLSPLPTLANPGVAPAVPVAPVVTNPGALVFDAEQKDYDAKVGEPTANFTFNLTNVSSAEVLV